MLKFTSYIIPLLCFIGNTQATWQNIPNSLTNQSNQRFDDVFFINENIGWAANGAYAAVYKTINGGLSWTEQLTETQLGGNYYFRNIEFLNENIGFLGTLNNELLKTIDGGSNWSVVSNITPIPPAICGIETSGDSTVYGCGAYFAPAFVIKSTDNGNTWQYLDMSSYANALVEVVFLNENTGFVSGRNDNGGIILKTTDGGTSWSELYNTNTPGEYVWKMQVLENNNDVIFGAVSSVYPNNGSLIKTTDAGLNWSSFDAPETDIQAVGFINENKGWMGGHTTGFYETNNGGLSWTNLNIGNNLNRIFIINSSLAFAGGTSLYKYTEETLNLEYSNEEKRNQLNLTLMQNPVKTLLEFTIEFPFHDNLLIELYDIDGKFIKQLTRDRLSTKTTKQYSFSVEDLNSGTYLLNLHSNTGRQFIKFIKE
ncbi:YCF48-related protein [Hyunsoonleella aestuarii]|uniref:T9SS type A sorting domain-containing protein n=1 Tax=Hyunsoonleella aestuarii TaxID=912802 RepID=A0ABP8ECL0_9FLAO|nr:YCF48-related protein [Hyunsoonleella aestuarii]